MAASTCITGEPGGSYCEINGTAGPDDHLMEAGVASVKLLANYSSVTKTPFFLAVGFHKPHIPWTIPTRFFNEEHGVPRTIDETELPLHPAVPEGMPPMAWNRGLGHNALDSYADANRYPLHPNVTFPDPLVKAMRRGYRAAVAYMDWMTGNVLQALNTSSAVDHTVVLFLGDHGYQLGEHNLWCTFSSECCSMFSDFSVRLSKQPLSLSRTGAGKMTVFELGTRVPFMIRVPGSISQGKATTALVEAVDVFPTLVTVAGKAAASPSYLDGVSLAPVLADPTATVKQAAFSEFVKCYSCCKVPDPPGTPPWAQGDNQPGGKCEPPDDNGPGRHRCPAFPALPADPTDLSEMETCFFVPREQIDFIGYSMRTSEYRYTEWLHFDGKALHGDFTRRVARELYSHTADPGNDPDVSENENIEESADAELLNKLHDMLVAGFKPPAVQLPQQ